MRDALKTRCDAIEEAYELMLTYAAQGVTGDAESQAGGQLRGLLTRAVDALSGLAALVNEIVAQDGLEPAERYQAFAATLQRDASGLAYLTEAARACQSCRSAAFSNRVPAGGAVARGHLTARGRRRDRLRRHGRRRRAGGRSARRRAWRVAVEVIGN